MKKDSVEIIQTSPLSLLESTRKDFESLLSGKGDSDSSSDGRRRPARKSKHRSRDHRNEGTTQNVEMVDLAPLHQSFNLRKNQMGGDSSVKNTKGEDKESSSPSTIKDRTPRLSRSHKSFWKGNLMSVSKHSKEDEEDSATSAGTLKSTSSRSRKSFQERSAELIEFTSLNQSRPKKSELLGSLSKGSSSQEGSIKSKLKHNEEEDSLSQDPKELGSLKNIEPHQEHHSKVVDSDSASSTVASKSSGSSRTLRSFQSHLLSGHHYENEVVNDETKISGSLKKGKFSKSDSLKTVLHYEKELDNDSTSSTVSSGTSGSIQTVKSHHENLSRSLLPHKKEVASPSGTSKSSVSLKTTKPHQSNNTEVALHYEKEIDSDSTSSIANSQTSRSVKNIRSHKDDPPKSVLLQENRAVSPSSASQASGSLWKKKSHLGSRLKTVLHYEEDIESDSASSTVASKTSVSVKNSRSRRESVSKSILDYEKEATSSVSGSSKKIRSRHGVHLESGLQREKEEDSDSASSNLRSHQNGRPKSILHSEKEAASPSGASNASKSSKKRQYRQDRLSKSTVQSDEEVDSDSAGRSSATFTKKPSPRVSKISKSSRKKDKTLLSYENEVYEDSESPCANRSAHSRVSKSSRSIKSATKSSRSLKSGLSSKALTVASSSSSSEAVSEGSAASGDEVDEDQQQRMLIVTVHQLHQLILEEPSTQPMVVAHAVDANTGRYVRRQGVAVPPQCTGSRPAAAGGRSTTWNQQLLFDFDTARHLHEALLLFEIVAEPSAGAEGPAQQQATLLAWAFLRPVSRTGVRHVGSRLQLQLYRVPVRRFLSQRSKINTSDIFGWFQNVAAQDKYPSSLYVTLAESSSQPASVLDLDLAAITGSPLKRRLNGQTVKLPTRKMELYLKTDCGCLMAAFSPDGSLLALALTDGRIQVQPVVRSSAGQQLDGHRGNVYDLDWFVDGRNRRLLSAGADCTARLWNAGGGARNGKLSMDKSPCLLLAHPAYVYGCRFLGDSQLIATTCFDQLVRLWRFNDNHLSVELLESYAQHAASVNCLVWDSQRRRLYSGDAAGSISVWKADTSSLEHQRTFEIGADRGGPPTSVNWLSFHPTSNRLLCHCRGNQLYMIEPDSAMKLVSYTGIYNPRLRLTSTISPCGSYVVAGSEDGSVHWFDAERGDLMAVLSFGGAGRPVTAVAFHPTDHALAVCSLNAAESVVLLEFDKNDTQARGFSLVTLPRTVRQRTSEGTDSVGGSLKDQAQWSTPSSAPVPHLDKLHRIFRKLDLVKSWTHTKDGAVAACSSP